MAPRQIGLHLGGLIVLIGLLAGWYWQATGARAVPALTESLKSDDAKVRIAAAQALAEIGPVAKAAVPDLLNQALHDPEPGDDGYEVLDAKGRDALREEINE